jgi:hypothetical protein
LINTVDTYEKRVKEHMRRTIKKKTEERENTMNETWLPNIHYPSGVLQKMPKKT